MFFFVKTLVEYSHKIKKVLKSNYNCVNNLKDGKNKF